MAFETMKMRVRWLPAAATLVSLLACGGEEPTDDPTPTVCTAADYDAAIHDSAVPTAEDVYTGLWPISPSNTRLTWNGDGSAVRMVAWTTFTGYQQGDNVLSREVWVTAVPQLKELCRTLPDDAARIVRINQFLGLPPANERDNGRQFVEMWVKPGDMFRPCPDPEIDDASCGMQFPSTVSAEHKDWFTRNYSSSFGFWQQTRYPWTGLGYTYDWCNADTHVGASEYVIRAGSTINVTAIIDRQTYCAP
jgi:hypothetical protein